MWTDGGRAQRRLMRAVGATLAGSFGILVFLHSVLRPPLSRSVHSLIAPGQRLPLGQLQPGWLVGPRRRNRQGRRWRRRRWRWWPEQGLQFWPLPPPLVFVSVSLRGSASRHLWKRDEEATPLSTHWCRRTGYCYEPGFDHTTNWNLLSPVRRFWYLGNAHLWVSAESWRESCLSAALSTGKQRLNWVPWATRHPPLPTQTTRLNAPARSLHKHKWWLPSHVSFNNTAGLSWVKVTTTHACLAPLGTSI